MDSFRSVVGGILATIVGVPFSNTFLQIYRWSLFIDRRLSMYGPNMMPEKEVGWALSGTSSYEWIVSVGSMLVRILTIGLTLDSLYQPRLRPLPTWHHTTLLKTSQSTNLNPNATILYESSYPYFIQIHQQYRTKRKSPKPLHAHPHFPPSTENRDRWTLSPDCSKIVSCY